MALVHPAFATTTKTVIAEAQYVMADGDTLASAEEKVMQRAQRKAVEEAGVYLESTFHDWEREWQGRTIRNTSWEIRTITAAVTETKTLDSRRSFDQDRPVFFLRIRATVDLQRADEIGVEVHHLGLDPPRFLRTRTAADISPA